MRSSSKQKSAAASHRILNEIFRRTHNIFVIKRIFRTPFVIIVCFFVKTVESFGCFCCRPPRGGRGLKSDLVAAFPQIICRPPRGGAWIEMCKGVTAWQIYLPSLPEQHRIVTRIESLFAKLDEAKEKAQAVVDGFELRKSAILHKAFTGELTERWRKERGVGLDSWEEICFGDLILSGPQNGLYKPKDVYGSGIKILRIDGFYDGNVEDWETLKRLTLSDVEIKLYELHLDEIVINRVNSMPYLGKSALIRELPETCVFESNMMRISLNKERVIPEFH